METMTKKPFDYLQWLQSLNVGDEVTALKNVRTVVGVSEDVIMVDINDNIAHFCRETGRQLGNKAGSWRDGTLKPYTDEERATQKEREEKEQKRNDKKELVKKLQQAIVNDPAGYYGCSESALFKHPKAKLLDLLAAVEEINNKSYCLEPWEV